VDIRELISFIKVREVPLSSWAETRAAPGDWLDAIPSLPVNFKQLMSGPSRRRGDLSMKVSRKQLQIVLSGRVSSLVSSN